MAVSNRKELLEHFGHDIEVAVYAGGDSVTIECLDCCCVLIAAEDLEDSGETKP